MYASLGCFTRALRLTVLKRCRGGMVLVAGQRLVGTISYRVTNVSQILPFHVLLQLARLEHVGRLEAWLVKEARPVNVLMERPSAHAQLQIRIRLVIFERVEATPLCVVNEAARRLLVSSGTEAAVRPLTSGPDSFA